MDEKVSVLEREQNEIEEQIWKLSLELLRPHYKRRREVTLQLSKFWPRVLDQCELLSEYMNYEDTDAIDVLEDLWIEWDTTNPKNFVVSCQFGASKNFPAQTVSKSIWWDVQKEAFAASAAPIEWYPNHSLVSEADVVSGQDSSFFAWFAYTDADDETHSEISRLISDEIFPRALDFWLAAINEQSEEEYDISD